MTINDPVKFCAGLWDWAILDGCFGETRIRPTDIDGLIERRGKFFLLETKAPGADVPDGQMRTFDALLETGAFHILIVWGETNKPQRAMLYKRGQHWKIDPCSIQRLREIVSNWYRYADSPSPIEIRRVSVPTGNRNLFVDFDPGLYEQASLFSDGNNPTGGDR